MSIIPRKLRQFKRLPCLTSVFGVSSFAPSSPTNAEHQRFHERAATTAGS
jgi:hypothetical protein